MAVTKAQSSIWAAEVLANLNSALVFEPLCNTDYEGEIQGSGSSVKIISISSLTAGTYTADNDITINPLTDAETVLNIDQTPYAAFYLDDVHKAQSKPELFAAGQAELGYALAAAADTYVAGLHSAVTAAGNKYGDSTTPKVVDSGDDAYTMLVELNKILSKNNVPVSGRWVVVPPEITAYLQLDDRFAKNANTNEYLVNGRVGRAAGLDIYESNAVANTSGAKYKIIAGHKGSIAFAGQLDTVEIVRKEKGFGGIAKGLMVFGAKVTRPTGLAVATVSWS